MERRILAELFVEDDRAIEEDLGTINYVEREAGWMPDSGIRVGQMRILDEDDPEDIKASNLADKIFNSEENKQTKVWVVEEENVEDVTSEREIRIFSTYEQAKACFDKFVASEKDNDPLMECDDKVIEESEGRFAIWQDGRYCKNHYEINIIERMVH